MCGSKAIRSEATRMCGAKAPEVLSAGSSRLTDEDTQDWEAAFRELMANHDPEPFFTGSPAIARPKRRRASPAHPYRGIRQRAWGRWSAEIRDPKQGVRVWIGTFDTAEDAARAYDAEARRILGANARTNFPADGDRPRPSSLHNAVDATDNRDPALTSCEVCSASPSDKRILLECCSDDVMESLLAFSDNMEFVSPVVMRLL
ncbi:unnamed protein product [Alopecurus aequalis]